MLAPKSAGRIAIKAFFAFIRQAEATRGAGRWSLDEDTLVVSIHMAKIL